SDLIGLCTAPIEGTQRWQSANDVGEMRREKRERLPALARTPLGVPPDEPHEHGYQRQRQQHDARRDEIDGRDESEDGDGDDGRENDLGQIAAEGGLETV